MKILLSIVLFAVISSAFAEVSRIILPESEGFELIETETILEKETKELGENEFNTGEIPAETFNIEPRNITPKKIRNKRGVGAASMGSAGRVFLLEGGKKIVSAAGDEVIDRTGMLHHESNNNTPRVALTVGAVGGGIIGGVVGSWVPVVGTMYGVAGGAVIGSGIVYIGHKIIS